MSGAARGFALSITLPQDVQEPLRVWTDQVPGATWDPAGAHVTVARLTGTTAPADVVAAVREACRTVPPFDVILRRAETSPYWGKPGMEIVLVTGQEPSDTAGIQVLRSTLLDALEGIGLVLAEGGAFIPHLTLTTGLPALDAEHLTAVAASLDVRFRAEEVSLWTGTEADEAAGEWYLLETIGLGADA